MPLGAFQPGRNCRVACMYMRFCHIKGLSPMGG
jgi:hypothetical protein